jgi:hypothetical protein
MANGNVAGSVVANIIVVCGGSGIRTLKRLNELFSQDDYWRERMDNEIYYVVVDTDVEEIRELDASIRADLVGLYDSVSLTPLKLAEGESHLQPLVQECLAKEGSERILDHWWNRGPKAPFVAPNVIGLTKGAGQCPPVSYFLAWKNLDDLQKRFEELVQSIRTRLDGGFGPKSVVNFLIVSGLAGGTGRGSWQLIAFKLRQELQRRGKATKPRAFLFDASVFHEIYRAEPEQEVPMKVNSLTGMSELHCWVQNRKKGQEDPNDAYLYQLPSMKSPADKETDVLKTELGFNRNSAAPVDHAYLIFRDNGVAALDQHEQYCQMVAAGIYGMLSRSSIDRQEINSPNPYVGMAAATFEVNAAQLRRYFESKLHLQTTVTMMETDGNKVKAAVDKFFATTQLRVDVDENDMVTHFQPKREGLLVEAVLDLLLVRSDSYLKRLQQAMEEDDVDASQRALKVALKEQPKTVRECFEQVIKERKLDPLTVVKDIAEELLKTTRSVGIVYDFLQRVGEELVEEVKEMPSKEEMAQMKPTDLSATLKQLASRPFIFMRRFTKAERETMLNETRKAIPGANYEQIRRCATQYFEGWKAELDRFLANANNLKDSLLRLERKFSKECRRTTSDQLGDAHDALFADPNRPEDEGLVPRFQAEKFFRRELRMPCTNNDVEALLKPLIERTSEGDQGQAEPDPLDRAVHDALFDVASSRGGAQGMRQRLSDRLEQAMHESVGLPCDFMQEHFSLLKVVEKTIEVWQARLGKKMRSAERKHLEERFAETFGYRPKPDPHGNGAEYLFPDAKEFILHMAASLALTCKPWWELRTERGQDCRVLIFAPVTYPTTQANKIVKDIINDSSITADVRPMDAKRVPGQSSTGNPFLLLTYAAEGVADLKDVRSLNYYNESGVLNLMRETEREDGETIFYGGKNGGLGYVDPLYVREPRIRDLRWRPWVPRVETDTAQEVARVEQQSTVDALLYALFPGSGKLSKRLAELQAELEKCGWAMPLLADQGRGRYVVTRPPLRLVKNQIRVDRSAAAPAGWDADSPVAAAAGIQNVWLALACEGDSPKPEWRDRMIEESNLFWNTILTGLNLAHGTPAFREIMEEYVNWLAAKARASSKNEAIHRIWSQLQTRANEMTEA